MMMSDSPLDSPTHSPTHSPTLSPQHSPLLKTEKKPKSLLCLDDSPLRKHQKKVKSVVFVEKGQYLVPHLHNNWFDKTIGSLSGNLMIANWIYSFTSLQCLPEIISIVNIKQGISMALTKHLLLSIPLLSTLSLIRYARLACHPEKMSYPVKVNGTNARKVYSRGKVSSRMKGLLTQFFFLSTNYLLIEISRGKQIAEHDWSLRSVLGVIAATLVSFGSLHCLFYL